MKPLIIIGASAHGRVVADCVLQSKQFHLVGFLDNQIQPDTTIMGHPVLGGDDALKQYLDTHSGIQFIVAIGDNATRRKVVEKISATYERLCFATLIHQSAYIAQDVTIEPGSVIMTQACIQPGSHIGAHSIINTRASLDHDNHLGSFASIAPGVISGGDVNVGSGSAIGIGATIKHGITIGEHSVIGAGSVVLKDIEDHTVAYGNPAKPIRKREENEAYL